MNNKIKGPHKKIDKCRDKNGEKVLPLGELLSRQCSKWTKKNTIKVKLGTSFITIPKPEPIEPKPVIEVWLEDEEDEDA